MLRVIEADYLGDFRVRLAFSDGFAGTVDLAGLLDGPVFVPLNDKNVFQHFELTDHTLQWACGADFAPEYLREIARAESLTTAHP
ncbi:DUF2442 domain-containing protein [Botrimarina mediterranea]|uniref:DUF2442 domain-containing protein n=1 Tax=Botrimarina mediterranea TaxID=2528022 RepID=A0A518K2Z4_9BACT|nr:DUF2442 domain-containing protein [Botrimarina mediterranea]QDV72171.1 hypothetical protein Spa11_03430 [Botrimarina mediterranea]QDV76714.1 hypothetical protein K2D_02950 [Planctomycetes bacterium K2D]